MSKSDRQFLRGIRRSAKGKYEIMCSIMQNENRTMETDLLCVAELFAERLALISNRLGDDDMSALIRIGAAIYGHGIDEFERKVAVQNQSPTMECSPTNLD